MTSEIEIYGGTPVQHIQQLCDDVGSGVRLVYRLGHWLPQLEYLK